MKKGIIIYYSRYGAAKQYALWASEMLNIKALNGKLISEQNFEDFDYVIVVTSLYMGNFLAKEHLEKFAAELKSKKLFLLLVGATNPSEKERIELMFEMNIPVELAQNCIKYYVQGKSIHSELSFKDRLLLKIGAMFTKDPKEKATMLSEFNAIQKSNLNLLIEQVQLFH